MSSLKVLVAVYGTLCGNEDSMHAIDATQQLQVALDHAQPAGIVNINNDTMGGDPCRGTTKFFGAVVSLDGNNLLFACQEGQTIDFFHSQSAAATAGLAKAALEKQ